MVWHYTLNQYYPYFFYQESDQRLYKPALESLRSQIRASTTSMTSVPKPLKFLRPHYDSLKEVHENIKDAETKVSIYSYVYDCHSQNCCYWITCTVVISSHVFLTKDGLVFRPFPNVESRHYLYNAVIWLTLPKLL